MMAITAALLMHCVDAQSSINTPPQPGTPAHDAKDSTTSEQAEHSGKRSLTPPPLRTVRDHWNLFVGETLSPVSAASTMFNASFSQVTHSDPRYGSNAAAYGQRIGTSAADIGTQNFFGDFLIASAFHEDPRYFRRGSQYGFWNRFGYAISRAVIVRTDSGRSSFNWDNVLGSALSTGFSNLYYPPPSRTGGAMLIHFGTDVADTGFINLAPEFWPDFRRKVFGWYHHPSTKGH
jgi:hypothetical protein